MNVTPVQDEQQLEELLSRGVADIIPREMVEKKLATGERMRVYLGVDPTGPSVHIGHAVILRKLRALQDLGHEIIFLIGDFTARIGDPTGKDKMRVTLTHEDVLANAQTYKEQIAKVLRFDGDNPVSIKFNAEWLDALRFQDVIELGAKFTVQQMLERDMFDNRMKEGRPIYVHEFFYPLMQGYDSVAMDVDGEVGGSDQLFNMLAGRTLLKEMKGKEKFVMTFELLEGLDGRKMSKSYNNIVGVTDEPNDMFGKIMAVKDELLPRYFELATDVSMEKVAEVKNRMEGGENPRDIKIELAKEIVGMYHNAEAADIAEQEFFKVFAEKERPTDIPEHELSAEEMGIVDVVAEVGFAQSKSEARRLVQQGGVKLNDEKVEGIDVMVRRGEEILLQVGKRKFITLK